MMTKQEAAELDEWRWMKATGDYPLTFSELAEGFEEYRRLVREDVRPPAEADRLFAIADELVSEVYRVTGFCERDLVLRALRRGIELERGEAPVTTKGPNMDTDASKLDEWRWQRAGYAAFGYDTAQISEYRRLVRDDVRPPAEPDEDMLDTRAIIAKWHFSDEEFANDILDGKLDDKGGFSEALSVVHLLKVRIRRQVIEEQAFRFTPRFEPCTLPVGEQAIGGKAIGAKGTMIYNDGKNTVYDDREM